MGAGFKFVVVHYGKGQKMSCLVRRLLLSIDNLQILQLLAEAERKKFEATSGRTSLFVRLLFTK